MPEREKRHLTTILVADVAGYSALMAVDEDRWVTYRIGINVGDIPAARPTMSAKA